MSWNFPGPNHFLYAAQRRLGFAPAQVHRCAKDPELYRLNSIVAGLCETFHRVRRERGVHGPYPAEVAAAAATLAEAEKNVQRLALMTVAAAEMVDDAYRGWRIDIPARSFAVLSDHDTPAAPAVVTTDVVTTDDVTPATPDPAPDAAPEAPPVPAPDPGPIAYPESSPANPRPRSRTTAKD